jgi:hypothetical protein
MLWKGLFFTVEVLPQYQNYLGDNNNNNNIKNGFSYIPLCIWAITLLLDTRELVGLISHYFAFHVYCR